MDSLTAQDPQSIQKMFGLISKKYDQANSVLSLGIHHRWKKKVIQKSHVKMGDSILDCATGTGDLAFLFEKRLKNSGEVLGTDFCEPMLEVARKKAQKLGSQARFQFADVTNLPFKDHSFNIATISFGIRNVQNPAKALSELGRVVKSGGQVLVLEFGQPQTRFISAIYGFYSRWILPRIGGWMSGQPQAYQYLQSSSAIFPCGSKFLDLAKTTGYFSDLSYIPLQFGIAYLYCLRVK